MVSHRFFQGGREHRNGSIGQRQRLMKALVEALVKPQVCSVNSAEAKLPNQNFALEKEDKTMSN